jgi:hypothetical protein
VFGDLSCYDCINNPQDPTAKLQIKMGMNFPLDAPQSCISLELSIPNGLHMSISLLDGTGLSYVWNNQCILHTNDIKFTVKQILSDQFIQK